MTRSSSSANSGAQMVDPQSRVLIVDDDPIVAESLAEFLSRQGHTTATACDGLEALDLLEEANTPNPNLADAPMPFGLVVTDINMARCDGLELLKRIRKEFQSVAVITITGFGKIEDAVEAIKLGAVDYLTKPLVDEELLIAVNKAVQQHALLHENITLLSQLTERYGMGNIVGSDYRMQKIYDLVEAVAQSRTTVLIDGQSGTGKTMVAKAVHERSNRRTGPFVTFSCGAIPETLLESELFGHVKGAFTGADTDKPGRCLAANGGTLFIDEINSATPALQLKLLRVLQEKQFEPVGSTHTVSVDVRFVLATNQLLPELVERGDFREDLFYRINVVNIHLPSLSDRTGDIPVLAHHFLQKYCKEIGRATTGFSAEAMEGLRAHQWPGNVRELENAIERAVVLCRRPIIELEDLPDTVRASMGHVPGYTPPGSKSAGAGSSQTGSQQSTIPALIDGWTPMPLSAAMEEPERQILLAALKANDWNRQETAKQLDINRTTLYKKIKQYGLEDLA